VAESWLEQARRLLEEGRTERWAEELARAWAELIQNHLEPDNQCWKCKGCGQVADTDNQEPWTAWSSLPPGSDAAVRMGLVKPIRCPACSG
jgi:hypothetical protein